MEKRPKLSCKEIVEVPTISVVKLGEQKTGTLVVQWWGEADRLQEESQFLFPIIADPDAIHWMNHPEWFRVAFLGQVKDWPSPKALPSIAQLVKGNVERWVILLTSSHIGVNFSNGFVGPAAYVCQVVLLLDPVVGLVTPRPYCNPKVLLEETIKVSARAS